MLFDQVRATAIGALFFDRFTPCHEVAVRILVAAVECAAGARAFFDDFAFSTFGAGNSSSVLFDEFAGWVVGAGDEFAEASELLDELTAALRAIFLQRDVGLLLRST